MSSKKSFILHKDSLSFLNTMPDELAGKWIKAIYHYQMNGCLPDEIDPRLEYMMYSFISQFERDEDKWKSIAERNKANGSKGGRPKKQNNPSKPKKPSGLFGNPSKPKKAVSVSVSDNVNDSVSVSDNNKDIYVNTKPFKENVRRINEDKKILTKTGVEEFINHWAEVNQKTKRMRWQEQDFFEIPKRMSTWASNNFSGKAKPHKRGERGPEYNSQVF